MMKTNIMHKIAVIFLLTGLIWGCGAPQISLKESGSELPNRFLSVASDSMNHASISWKEYFEDETLIELIDSALQNNQELNIVLQELVISENEVLEKSGEYLPFVGIGIEAGTEKAGRFTRDGAVEQSLEIDEGKEFPEPLNDFSVGFEASWEVDIWRKLRNAKDAAQLRFLARTEGKNFLVTQLISEIADTYYELMVLDNQLEIIEKNLKIQKDALEKMRVLKQSAKVNQLAVNRFEAQFFNTQNQQYAIRQNILETENRLNYLVGSYSLPVERNSSSLMQIEFDTIQAGIPSQLLYNRPDIRQAELEMLAYNLDVRAARADFYPKLDLRAGLGFRAFDPTFLFKPESLIYNAAGELITPLINRKAIKARFNMANAEQIQSVYYYEQTILNAYTDVLNQLGKLENYSRSFQTKKREVAVLDESVEIANSLFQYAKADYVEVLLTQEEVLDAQMELTESRLRQLQAKVNIYRALGGGWR